MIPAIVGLLALGVVIYFFFGTSKRKSRGGPPRVGRSRSRDDDGAP